MLTSWLKRKESIEMFELRDKVEKLQLQVADLERETDAHKEMKLAFRAQASRLGEALQECQQILTKSGLHLPLSNNTRNIDENKESDAVTESNNRLWSLNREAKEYGWAIHDYEEDADRFCQEVQLLSKQRHPYVIRLLAACLDIPRHGWIVTEHFHTTLTEWLHGQKKRKLHRTHPLPPLKARIRVALEVALGMQYLHEQCPRVIHRDLKPSNILLDDAFHAHIADFGFARYLQPNDMSLTGEIGTYIYMAPEVIRHEPYDQSCDVFSFGIILCELITGEPPYIEHPQGPMQIALSVACNNTRPALPSVNDGLLVDLIEAAWHKDPTERPAFAAIASVLKKAYDL